MTSWTPSEPRCDERSRAKKEPRSRRGHQLRRRRSRRWDGNRTTLWVNEILRGARVGPGRTTPPQEVGSRPTERGGPRGGLEPPVASGPAPNRAEMGPRPVSTVRTGTKPPVPGSDLPDLSAAPWAHHRLGMRYGNQHRSPPRTLAGGEGRGPRPLSRDDRGSPKKRPGCRVDHRRLSLLDSGRTARHRLLQRGPPVGAGPRRIVPPPSPKRRLGWSVGGPDARELRVSRPPVHPGSGDPTDLGTQVEPASGTTEGRVDRSLLPPALSPHARGRNLGDGIRSCRGERGCHPGMGEGHHVAALPRPPPFSGGSGGVPRGGTPRVERGVSPPRGRPRPLPISSTLSPSAPRLARPAVSPWSRPLPGEIGKEGRARTGAMVDRVELLTPSTMPPPVGYSHVAMVRG